MQAFRSNSVALVLALAGLLPLPANAQALDGIYVGKLSCEVIAGQTRRELATDIRITIAGTNVSYEREILNPDGGGTTGIKERGTGAVKGNALSMAAAGRGNSWSYEASYTHHRRRHGRDARRAEMVCQPGQPGPPVRDQRAASVRRRMMRHVVIGGAMALVSLAVALPAWAQLDASTMARYNVDLQARSACRSHRPRQCQRRRLHLRGAGYRRRRRAWHRQRHAAQRVGRRLGLRRRLALRQQLQRPDHAGHYLDDRRADWHLHRRCARRSPVLDQRAPRMICVPPAPTRPPH